MQTTLPNCSILFPSISYVLFTWQKRRLFLEIPKRWKETEAAKKRIGENKRILYSWDLTRGENEIRRINVVMESDTHDGQGKGRLQRKKKYEFVLFSLSFVISNIFLLQVPIKILFDLFSLSFLKKKNISTIEKSRKEIHFRWHVE